MDIRSAVSAVCWVEHACRPVRFADSVGSVESLWVREVVGWDPVWG